MFVTTPEVDESGAKVNVKTKAVNDSRRPQKITVITRILDAMGIEAARAESRQDIQPETSVQFSQDTVVKSPSLWSIKSPALYTALVEVRGDKILYDRVKTQFGIRTIAFDAKKGFVLNGEPTLLK
jgi:beta-galactosidase